MKNILNTFILSLALSMPFVSCTKVEPVSFTEESISYDTKSSMGNMQNSAELDVFFYNAYSEDINVMLKEVNYCSVNAKGEIEKTNLYNGTLSLDENLMLVNRFDVKVGKVYSTNYIEYVYDAVQIVNGFTLAENEVAKSYLNTDIEGSSVNVWEADNTYYYSFSPEFNEITFNPSTGDWDEINA